MKKLGFIIFIILVGIKSNGQNMVGTESSTFVIEYYDLFSFNNSEPNKKEWTFDLTITELNEEKFQACYSKELVNCLFKLNDLRKNQISLNKPGICFTYTLLEGNEIQVIEKGAIVEYLKELKKFRPPHLKKKQYKEISDNVDFYLEYEDELDKDLVRELKLIYQYENIEIPIGISGVLEEEEEEEMNLEELEDDEIEFLNQIDWKTIRKIDAFRTPEISESEFSFDCLLAMNLNLSGEKTNFDEIINTYFKGNLEIDKYDNVTLKRDQRHLTKEDKKLSYLLKEERTVKPKMTNITRLEIIKK